MDFDENSARLFFDSLCNHKQFGAAILQILTQTRFTLTVVFSKLCRKVPLWSLQGLSTGQICTWHFAVYSSIYCFSQSCTFSKSWLDPFYCANWHIFFSWALIENMKLSVMTEETSVSDRIPERPQSPASSASSSDWAPRTSISPGTFLRSFPVVFVSFLQWSCY